MSPDPTPALGRPRGLRRRRSPARIGLVTYWFNRGQATAMRMVRRGLEDAGYETYVLARPTTATFTKANFIATDDVWDQPRVTPASSFEIPAEEYRAWARANRLDAVLFFQNKDFDAITALREGGFATAGTFMWENFPQADVQGALTAYDCLYALNPWSLRRYADLGIARTHDVPFAIHPDEALEATGGDGPTTFMFVGGYLSDRKPLGAVVDAYVAGAGPDTRLVVKTQRPVRPGDLVLPRGVDDLRNRYKADPKDAVAAPLSQRDPRITTITDDLSSAEHHRLVSDADVLVGVSRWEGLGLHLYEAEPSGKCVLINDMEPYTSYAADRGNCVLSTSHVIGELRETPVHEPDVDSLAAAFAALSEPGAATARPEPDRGAGRWSAFSASLDGLVHTLLD